MPCPVVSVACLLLAAAAAAEMEPTCLHGEESASCDPHISLLQRGVTLKRNAPAMAPVENQMLQEKLKQTRGDLNELEGEFQGRVRVTAAPVPPVSTTNKCIIILTIQYFGMYTALMIATTIALLSNQPAGSTKLEKILKGAVETVSYAPMLGILFVATRERALALVNDSASGNPQDYDLPQSWVQTSMYIATICLAWGTLANLAKYIIAYLQELAGPAEWVFAIISKVALFALNVSIIVVIVGLIMMDRPPELLKLHGSMPVSASAQCVMSLTFQFFAVGMALEVVTMWSDLTRGGPLSSDQAVATYSKLAKVLEMAKNTVAFAPMLAVLFVMARMRALQLDPDGAPQPWARAFFYVCTYTMLTQTVIAIVAPYAAGAELEKGETDGDVAFTCENSSVQTALEAARWLIMLLLNVSMAVVVVSIIVIQAPEGQRTPPVSTTAACCMSLSFQYFAVYVFLWAGVTARQYVDSAVIAKTVQILTVAKNTVTFVPMLCVVMLGARMRALQLSHGKGNPQAWVQTCMKMAAFATLLQLAMVVVTALVTGEVVCKAEPKDGETPDFTLSIGGVISTVAQYLGLLMLYGGACGVMVGIFMMTPENCV